MAIELKRYTKEELLAILNQKCPDALAQFPSPDSFEFKMNTRDGNASPAVCVGRAKTERSTKIKGALWLEEYDAVKDTHLNESENTSSDGLVDPPADGTETKNPDKQANLQHPDHPDVTDKSENIPSDGLLDRTASGTERKNPAQLEELFIGLHYTNDEDARVNAYIKNAGGFKGTEIFGKMGKSTNKAIVNSPFSPSMKALFRFIMLHCGQDIFEEFIDGKGKIHGVAALVRALKMIARHGAEEEEGEGEEEDGEALFVKEKAGKRKEYEGVGKSEAKKKRVRVKVNKGLMKALRGA